MTDPVESHYCGSSGLADEIAERLRSSGKDLNELTAADLTTIDEFHIRGRLATMELAGQMKLTKDTRVLDIGSGLGGPARTLADSYGCHVTGLDLTQAFCDAAQVMSGWVSLDNRTAFQQGDATNLPFEDNHFDAAMTIHVAMNIAAKDKMYSQARRVLKPGGIFAVYDVLQGEGGDPTYPVPWAREPSISHLATPGEMEAYLTEAGFKILKVRDSAKESQSWFEARAARIEESGPPALSFQAFLGSDYPEMVRNQVRNLTERRIRTVSYICEA